MSRSAKVIITILVVVVLLVVVFAGTNFMSWLIYRFMPAEVRPAKIEFPTAKYTDEQFEALVDSILVDHLGLSPDDPALATASIESRLPFKHIERFRKAGIRRYEGPKTCLRCHKTIRVKGNDGKYHEEDLMDNLTHSAHYLFWTKRHPNVWGFNGKLADNFPMGKIDRPCPKPGSFAMTAWAALVVTERGDTLSEGCGQCHIGGQYAVPLGEMMPGYKVTKAEKDAIDCLICHSTDYDLNKRIVVRDPNGRYRWAQDRSLRAALTVTKPRNQSCLRCHQHNFGGDVYVDEKDPSFMPNIVQRGEGHPRVLHPGSKRGTPFSPSWDVHAAAGVQCIDCHETQGHRIAKGQHTTTMMSNDLPDVDVNCTKCHTEMPHHENPAIDDYLNMHLDKLACNVCHIPSLQEDNATMRDFAHPVFEEEAGIWVYHDIAKETQPGKGIIYQWWNGDCTFLGNPIGDNPNGANLYRFYNPTHVWPEYKDFDYAGWYEKVMRPIAKKKPSKIYAMKLFNGRQHVDLGNMGPFGGMFVPYNLPTYYVTGDPDSAAKVEMAHPMMKMMYGWMFKVYMMDKFMSFMDVDKWNTSVYNDVLHLKNVEPRWIPQDAMLEISHAIRRKGALTCDNCHSPNGVMDFKALGYTPEEVESLKEPREL